MRLTVFALVAAAAIGSAKGAEFEAADSEYLTDFWSKFDGWKWNCSSWVSKENEDLQLDVEDAGEEPEWLADEWVSKMVGVRHHKAQNMSDMETDKLTKMWSICDLFKGKTFVNHTKVHPAFAEEEEAVDEASIEKADEEFLLDFWRKCAAWKHNKTWAFGGKKNFTWFKAAKEGEAMTAELEN